MNHRKFLPAGATALVPAGVCRILRVGILPETRRLVDRLAKEKVNGT